MTVWGCRLLFLLLGIFAAQATAQRSSPLQDLEINREKNPFKLTLVTQLTTDVKNNKSLDKQSSLDWVTIPQYQVTDNYILRASFSGSQIQGQSQRSILYNAGFSLRRTAFRINDRNSILPQATLRIPTNSDDRDQSSYLGSIAIGMTWIISARLMDMPFSIYYSATANKNAHRFKRSRSGGSNVNMSLSQSLDIEKFLTDKFSLSLSGGWSQARTYSNRDRSQYSLGQTLRYAATQQAWITFGHEVGGSLLAADGESRNIDFFSERDSVIYTSLSLTL